MAITRVRVISALIFLVGVDVTFNVRLSQNDPIILWTENCDWDFTKSTNVLLPLGPSPRWEEFQERPENSGLNLYEYFASALSFSVSPDDNGKVTLELYSKDLTQTTKHTFTAKEVHKLGDTTYAHFTLWKRNNNFWDILTDESSSSINVSSIFPQWMFVNNHWIVHDYNFVSSQKESSSENMIFLEKNDLKDICISLLYALNNNSILELQLITNNLQTRKVTLVGNDSELITWQRHYLRAKSNKMAWLKITRKLKEVAAGPGFWALDDIQFCNPGVDKNKVTHKLCPNQRKQTFEKNYERAQKDQNDPEHDNNNVKCTPRYFIRSKYVTNFKETICACNATHLTLFIKTENHSIDRIKFNDDKKLSYKGQIIKVVGNKVRFNPLKNLTTGIWIASDEEHTFNQLCDTDDRACESSCSSTEATTIAKTTQEAHTEETVKSVKDNSLEGVLWGTLVSIVLFIIITTIVRFKLRIENPDGVAGDQLLKNSIHPLE